MIGIGRLFQSDRRIPSELHRWYYCVNIFRTSPWGDGSPGRPERAALPVVLWKQDTRGSGPQLANIRSFGGGQLGKSKRRAK
jgi:hypothetical protein